jgi:REP element-mobilizing transposase RayT
MPFDPDLYHRRSIRLPAHDYSGNGPYFVTICTIGRQSLFGTVKDGAMGMNELGWIAWEEWEKSAEIRKEIEIGPFVVMPNHLHGIVTINQDANSSTSIGGRKPANISADIGKLAGPMLHSRSLGSFIGGYKAVTTRMYNRLIGTSDTLLWQRNYHERVVRTDSEMERIWAYIENNPQQWSIDRENPDPVGQNALESFCYQLANQRS